MILEIDIGNTWAKWRLRDQQQIIARNKTRSDGFPQADLFTLRDVQYVHVASVQASAVIDSVLAQLRKGFAGQSVLRAQPQAKKAGVINAYANPANMGVDRWLAMLAAHNHQGTNYPVADAVGKGCLVVSCGTAVTIDLVPESGVHEGGYILPGLFMMREALLSKTGRIQYLPDRYDIATAPGDSTATAVEHGAVLAVLSAIKHAYADVTSRWGSANLFLTGGDAKELQEILGLPCYYVEELVLDGLQYALSD